MVEGLGIQQAPRLRLVQIAYMATIAIVVFIGVKPPAHSKLAARRQGSQNCEFHIVADVAAVPILHSLFRTSSKARTAVVSLILV